MTDHSTKSNIKRMYKLRQSNVYTLVAREVADEMKISKNPFTEDHNDERDAFRHAYAIALLSYRYGDAIGKLGGDINEWKNRVPGQTDLEHEDWMDFHNNAVGRRIAADVKARGGGEEELKQAVAEALANDELIVSPFDPRRTYEEHGDPARAIQESKDLLAQEHARELTGISNDDTLTAEEKHQSRLRLKAQYEELERQREKAVGQMNIRTTTRDPGEVSSSQGGGTVHVEAYTRRNGEVRAYDRRTPQRD